MTAALATTPALADTTVERTIQDTDTPGDNLLEYAPGEDYVVLGADEGFRPPRSGSLLNFLQLSDFQMVDEESPGRVEFLDTTQRVPGANPFSAAYRPQESLTAQITEAMVRQVRDTTSPLTGRPLELTVLTGDNADSQQYNETRWFIDILDGRKKVDPDSGVQSQLRGCPTGGLTYQDNGSPYDGVRDDGQDGVKDNGYYEPDSSDLPRDDGDGYSPDRTVNQEEVPGPPGSFADVTVRDFPGLFESAQRPFKAVGLDMPWYTAFGNHDALVQGNSPDAFLGPIGPGDAGPPAQEKVSDAFDAIVRGCVKPSSLPTGLSEQELAALQQRAVTDPAGLLADPAFRAMAGAVVVPPDARRCHLAKDEPNDARAPCDSGGWIQQHSRTSGYPTGHGFERFSGDGQKGDGRPPEARLNHDGYYSFRPRKGLRFIVFDTITDGCGPPICSEGSVDHTQYKWLEHEIVEAAARREYVVLFSHHTLRTTRLESDDLTERPLHFGERYDRKDGGMRPIRPDELPETTLEDLFCRHANVLGHVNGHEHENYVLRHDCQDSVGKNPFYEIATAAHIDWPQQSRMLELFANRDRTMSLALTILDHEGRPDPGSGPAGSDLLRLASIGRELSYNDYQGSRGARGKRSDRNVIIKLDKRWPRGDESDDGDGDDGDGDGDD